MAEPAEQRAEMSRRAAWAALALVLVAGGALRFHALGGKELWLDESISAVAAAGSPAETMANVAENDAHPPLYYVALNLATRMTGRDEAGLRAVSALASIACVALTYAVGASLFGRGAGLVAAGLFAASSFQLYFAQEARLHAFVTLPALAATGVFVRIVKSRDGSPRALWPWMTAYGLLTAAMLLTYYYAAFVVAAHAAAFCALWLGARLRPDPEGRRWLLTAGHARNVWPMLVAAAAVGGVAFALLWGRVLLARMGGLAGVPSSPYGLDQVVAALRQMLTGPALDRVLWRLGGEQGGELLAASSALLVALPLLCLLLVAGRLRGAALMLVLLVAAPFACVALLPSRPHVFEAKHLVFVAPFLFIMLGAEGARTRRRFITVSAVALVLLVNAFCNRVYFRPEYHKEPWRAVVRRIESEWRPGDVIAAVPPYAAHVLRRYCRGPLAGQVVPVTGERALGALAASAPAGIWLVQLESRVAAAGHGSLVWLASWSDPSLGLPGPEDVRVSYLFDRSGPLVREGRAGWVSVDWARAGASEWRFEVLGGGFEGFSTFRTLVTVRRFAARP